MKSIPLHERPLASDGLKSYRCKLPHGGWIMIGVKDSADALKEALRSSKDALCDQLQAWDGEQYVACRTC